MSILRQGEEELHYQDNSHRWLCPDPQADQEAWSDRVRVHMELHGQYRDTPSRLLARPTLIPRNLR